MAASIDRRAEMDIGQLFYGSGEPVGLPQRVPPRSRRPFFATFAMTHTAALQIEVFC
jgi:hypothetical protein